MTKPLAIAIRHVAFEDLGSIEPALINKGFEVRYVEAGIDDISELTTKSPELVIVLGAPIGANQEAEYPFLKDELNVIETRLKKHQPILGICLGAQLMAKAMGARVYKGPVPEIGWSPIQLTQDGINSCLQHFADPQLRVLHWHNDTFDLPRNAVKLCSSTVYENQGFTVGNYGLALQFHLEVNAQNMERWFIASASEISSCQGTTVNKLREESREWSRSMNFQAAKVWEQWLGSRA